MPRSIKSNKRVEWVRAPDIDKKVKNLIQDLHLDWIEKGRIFCLRSKNSRARAYARIWGLSRIWQQVLGINSAYIIEVISEKFDKLSEKEKKKILLHELAHVPKNFSGSLVPHYKRGTRKFKDRVRTLVAQDNKTKK